MAKADKDLDVGPNALGTGQGIIAESIVDVIELQNYAHLESTVTYFSLAVEPQPAVWGVGASVAVHPQPISSVTISERYTCRIMVDPDVQGILFGATVRTGAASSLRVAVTVGPTTTNLDFTNASTTEELTTIFDTATVGTGRVRVLVEVDLLSGSGTASRLVGMRCEVARIDATDLPDPDNS